LSTILHNLPKSKVQAYSFPFSRRFVTTMLTRQLRRDPRLVWGRFSRFVNRGAASSAPAAAAATDENMSIAEQKRQLAKAALQQVTVHGWTQDAITAAVLEHPNMTISMSGLVTPSELINMFMDDFNHSLRHDAEKQQWSVFEKIKWRLEQVIPLVKSGQWHKGMAKGLQTPLTTRSQLHEFVELISPPGSSVLYQTALGGIFVASELHLLTDSSQDYQQTWKFLEARLNDLDQTSLVHFNGGGAPGGIPVAAYTAVATSLLDGLASLVLPSNSSSVAGTSPNDYKPNRNK
jgi:ubiquinone biosynthesis protein COQ9